MASRKEYTYQIKGNKLSLLEKDFSTTDGLNYTFSGTAGDGITDDIPSGTTVVKSPLSSVTDGIEIEYAYSPVYSRVYGADQEGSARHFVSLGYTGTNGNRLAFIIPNYDFSSGGHFSEGDKILVQGSGQWDGIHTVHSTSYLGLLVTTTKAMDMNSITIGLTIDATAKTITGGTTSYTNQIAEYLSAGDHYIYLGGTDTATAATNSEELFKVTSDGSGLLTATAQYSLTNGVVTETTPVLAAATNDTMAITKVVFNSFKFYPNVAINLLEDESDDIDVPPYLAKALVYYVKAKVAEDQMNIEAKEYMMREFRKMVEKHESSKIAGPRMMMPGNNAIR